MKKILYFGGVFQGEISFATDMQANGYEVKFIPDRKMKEAGKQRFNIQEINGMYKNESGIRAVLNREDPDYVIVRCWQGYEVIAKIFNKLFPKWIYWNVEPIPYQNYVTDEYFMKNYPSNYEISRQGKYCKNMFAMNKLEQEAFSDSIENVAIMPYGASPTFEGLSNTEEKIDKICLMNRSTGNYNTRHKGWKLIAEPIARQMRNKLDIYCYYGNSEIHKYIGKDNWLHFEYYELPEYVGKYKIFLNPNAQIYNRYTYSRKFTQTMGCGVFQIANRFRNCEKMFGPDEDKLVWSSSPEETVEKVQYFMENDEEREKIALRAKKFIYQKYQWYKRFEKAVKALGI